MFYITEILGEASLGAKYYTSLPLKSFTFGHYKGFRGQDTKHFQKLIKFNFFLHFY